MILLYAGLQRVPRELHEAADLEGVSAWQRLRWLLIPQLAPVIALNLVLITIASFNTFDLIIPLTGGGPARRTEVISLFMYRLGFFDLQAGRAAAVAVVMLLVNLVLAWVAGRLIMRDEPARARWRSSLVATPARASSPAWPPRPRRSCCRSCGCSSLSLKNKAGLFEYPPTWIPERRVARQLPLRAHAHAGAVVPVEQPGGRGVRVRRDAGGRRAGRLRAVARALPRPHGRCSPRCSSCRWCRR